RCKCAALEKLGRRLLPSAFPVGVYVVPVSENELQGELDLPRIVGIVAGRADFAESSCVSSVRIVRGAADGHHAVTAEAWSIKVGMVGDIKDFRAELQLALLSEWEVLKDGKIQAVEAGAGYRSFVAPVF